MAKWDVTHSRSKCMFRIISVNILIFPLPLVLFSYFCFFSLLLSTLSIMNNIIFQIFENTHTNAYANDNENQTKCNQKPVCLGLLRSDVMLETKCRKCSKPYCCWKQVEINTIASGFGHLGPISRDIQRCIFIYIISFEPSLLTQCENYILYLHGMRFHCHSGLNGVLLC